MLDPYRTPSPPPVPLPLSWWVRNHVLVAQALGVAVGLGMMGIAVWIPMPDGVVILLAATGWIVTACCSDTSNDGAHA